MAESNTHHPKIIFSIIVLISSTMIYVSSTVVLGSNNVNSSPPHLANISVSLTSLLIVWAKVISVSSPIICPYSSFTNLKKSISNIAKLSAF